MLNELPVLERSFRFSEENTFNYYCRYEYDTELTKNIKTQPRTPAFIVAYKIILPVLCFRDCSFPFPYSHPSAAT